MEHKPFFMDLKSYAEGKYCELFLKLFGLEDSDKLDRLIVYVREKVNSQKEYEKTDLSKAEYQKCMNVWQRLKAVCKDSWIAKEGLI